MPHSDLHKKKISKNLIMLAIIFGVVALIWMITMIKMARADEDTGERTAKRVINIEESFLEGREDHLASQDGTKEHWWYDDLSEPHSHDDEGAATDDGSEDASAGDDEDKTQRPSRVQNERKLRNTFNHNRGIGGTSTTIQ
jgi:hypothetical protein